MEGPRPLLEHELGDFVTYLSHHLRPEKSWSIADEYPCAIAGTNLHNVRVIKTDTGFASAAVMKPLVIKSPAGVFKVAAIGSVVTSPEHRNQGLSQKILNASLDAARAHGCDFAILWTNLFDFYRKLGFELAGSEVALALPASFNVPNEGLRFVNSNRIDPEALLRLYSQHTTGAIRTSEEVRKYLQIPNANVYTAWDAENRLQAYAVEGKGADLEGYVHEWGGGVSKVLPLLAHASQTSGRALHVIAPAHAQNFIRQLKELGATSSEGVLGMVKILNAPNLLLKLKKYMRAMGEADVVLEPRDGKFYIGHGDQIFSTDAERDLTRLIFGPLKASQLHPFDSATAAALERVLPLPMWIWGWDSV